MIVDSIEDDTDACLMQRLHHLFELSHSDCRRKRIGTIAAIRHIIVLRIIPPVELWCIEACLIYRSKIEQRLEVYRIDTEALEIFYRLRFCQCQILAFILQSRGR